MPFFKELRFRAKTIPDIARDEIPADGEGERRFFTVVVRDENGQPLHTARLSYAGMNLRHRPE